MGAIPGVINEQYLNASFSIYLMGLGLSKDYMRCLANGRHSIKVTVALNTIPTY